MIGIWLIQLGTPDDTSVPAVRRYLREFLMDPRVIDIPYLFRWILVHLFILPFRPAKSAEAYKKIWTERGSPLRFHTIDLAAQLQQKFQGRAVVEYGMRYGSPSLKASYENLKKKGVTKILAVPLYPQYAPSSTGTAIDAVKIISRKDGASIPIEFLEPFYSSPEYIQAVAAQAKNVNLGAADHILFSFHGLPEKQAEVYKPQCLHTAELVSEQLRLPRDIWSVCFQSRLGPTPWIQPYTDRRIDELANAGKKNLIVFCPSFVADCLETLEEIAIRAREQFLSQGGQSLSLIPAPNATDVWVQALQSILEKRWSALSH